MGLMKNFGPVLSIKFLIKLIWFFYFVKFLIFLINFSDHCPILLISKNVDWGPKPFRMLDCWTAGFKISLSRMWLSIVGHSQNQEGGEDLFSKKKSNV